MKWYQKELKNGKIYGLCWDYAAIYCAIANSYDLETRITAYKKYLPDINSSIDSSTKQGLSKDEYNELCKKLEANNVEFT